MELICLGDSLTFGYGVPKGSRWTTRLAQKTGWRIYNFGVCGDTTGGMLTRLVGQISPQLLESWGESGPAVLLMGGSNDIFYSETDAAARSNMGAMIHQLLGLGVSPIIGIPLPVIPSQVPEDWKTFANFAVCAEILESYGQWLLRCCRAFHLTCVDFRPAFRDAAHKPRKELFLDGMHPTEEGHRYMAEQLLKTLGERPNGG